MWKRRRRHRIGGNQEMKDKRNMQKEDIILVCSKWSHQPHGKLPLSKTKSTHERKHARAYTHILTRTHTHTRKHARARAHTHTHTHTHTHHELENVNTQVRERDTVVDQLNIILSTLSLTLLQERERRQTDRVRETERETNRDRQIERQRERAGQFN